jgi:hypothetical protein
MTGSFARHAPHLGLAAAALEVIGQLPVPEAAAVYRSGGGSSEELRAHRSGHGAMVETESAVPWQVPRLTARPKEGEQPAVDG